MNSRQLNAIINKAVQGIKNGAPKSPVIKTLVDQYGLNYAFIGPVILNRV